eukprot:gnl/Chilomastix_cuspidata/8608.p1 GENE.gnl/Chilomastix_cuspidata/8608~~gnl/Chilomastix_cuspidata/8608.p1  ORF type:complete len:230 (+),score=10.28 gnl/Chilomastix_cuspidata/8608:134-823(+)
MKKSRIIFTLFFVLIFVSSAYTLPIQGSFSTENLGDFSGSLTYLSKDDTSAELHIAITNTSPSDNGGYITGIAFNNPQNLIKGVSLSEIKDFDLITNITINNAISCSPFGYFDIGASSESKKTDWLGSGNPKKGIEVGSTAEFVFELSAQSGLMSIDEKSFFNELSENVKDDKSAFFAVRFRGFDDGGSDKVYCVDGALPVPEPSSMILLGIGFLSVFLGKRKLVKEIV